MRYGRFIRYRKRWLLLKPVVRVMFFIEDACRWLQEKQDEFLGSLAYDIHDAALEICDLSSEREQEKK